MSTAEFRRRSQRLCLLQVLGEIWERHPNQRLCQLLVNALQPANPGMYPYFVEDEMLLRRLKEYADYGHHGKELTFVPDQAP
jgi:hypothetical protein